MTTKSTADDLRTLVEESDAFDRCEECGTHVVNVDAHRCPTSDGPPETNRAAREARAAQDTRNDGDPVGVFRRSSGNTYAYHELVDGEVRCGCEGNTKAATFDVVSRAEAKSLGRIPCGTCERLQSVRAGDEE